MVTLCTSQAVLDRAGPFINSKFLSTASEVENFIEDAEQTIVAETRTDWITDYASVSDAVKASLKIATATHAAVDIIQTDISGFATKAEAITQMNVNENRFQRTMKALRERETQNIRSVE